MTTYRDAGVDIDEGNRAVALMAEAVRSTETPEVLSELGAFGGLFSADRLGPGKVLVASTDGVGTKVELAARFGRWRGLGADLVNHCINDILVQNARPLFFLDYIATASLVPETVAEVVEGMADACKAAGCAILGGETAEMPGVYAPGAVDIAGTIVGAADRDLLWPDLQNIAAGDVLISLPSVSPHTNGYSLIRRLLDTNDASDDLIDFLLTSHKSYIEEVEQLTAAGVDVRALAHITGGGLFENVPRVLPDNLAASVELGSWVVPDHFRTLVDWGGLPDEEAFRVWNMGVGMVVVAGADDGAVARDLGYETIGQVVPRNGGAGVSLHGDWR